MEEVAGRRVRGGEPNPESTGAAAPTRPSLPQRRLVPPTYNARRPTAMTTLAFAARSLLHDARAAGREAAAAASAALGPGSVDLTLLFATAPYDQAALLAGVAEHLDPATIVGCSGEGVIAGATSSERDHALALLAVRSDSLRFEPFAIEGYGRDSRGAGSALAAAVTARARDDAVGLWLFPDGLHGNCTEMLDALQEALAIPLVTVGGAAGDAMTFDRTYQYLGTDVHTDAIAAVLVSGRGTMEVAVSHGCTPIGLPRTVTRADDNRVLEIDGAPAWEVFKEYLDGDPQDLNGEGIVHLCIGQSLDDPAATHYAPYVIRTPLGLDKSSGALLFPGGGLATGQTICMTRRDPERILASARSCTRDIERRHPRRRPAFALQVDCAGRGKVLFGASAGAELVAPLRDIFGGDVPWAGFHSYGEIAPIGGRVHYHNYTVALSVLYDDDE